MGQSSSTHLKLKHYEPGDLESILPLLNQVFRWGDFKKANWKFNECPWGAFLFLGKDKDGIAALFGGVKVPLWCNGEFTQGILVGDSASSPVKRASRAFFRTCHFAISSFEKNPHLKLAFGFSNPRAALLGSKGFHFHNYGSVFDLSKKLSDPGVSKSLNHLESVRVDQKAPYHVDIVWEKFSQHIRMCVARNRQFYEWRFDHSPIASYHYVTLNPSGSEMSIFVLRERPFTVNHSTATEVYLMDFLLCSNDPIKIYHYFKRLEAFLILQGYARVLVRVPADSTYFRTLTQNLGYCITRTRYQLMCRPNHSVNVSDALSGRAFHFTFADWDML